MQKDANNRKHERKDTRKASHVSAELCPVRKPPFWFWTQRHREANIATCYANLSKYADALPYYTKAFELMPDRITSSNINREYGFALVGAGQREKAREVFGLGLTKPDLRAAVLRSLGLLDLYEGRYNDASARLKEAIEASQAEKNDIGVARTGRGKTADALIELDQVEKLDAAFVQAPWLAARLGVAFARVGSPDRAARVLEKIRAKISPTDHETESAANDLEGEIEMARGNFPRAIELLQKSRLDTYPPSIPLSLVGQARAYARCGQLEKSIPLYESLIGGEGGNPLAWEAQQPWLEAHYELAALHASRNNSKRAIELVDTLLGIWKNADADLLLLREAKTLRESLNR